MPIVKFKDLWLSKPIYGAGLPAKNKGLYNKYLTQSDIDKIITKYVDETQNKLLNKNDFLISRAGTILQYLHQSNEKIVYAGYLIKYPLNLKVCIPKYVYYYFLGPGKKEINKNINTGSTMPKLNPNISGQLKLNLPNIKKQQHIIDIIEPFEKLENKLKEITLKINKIKKILFESSKTNKIFINELLELNKKIKIQDLSLSQIFVDSKRHEIKFKKNVNYSGTIYAHKVGDLLIPKTSYFNQSIAYIKINKKYLLSNDQPVYKNKSSYNSLLILEAIVFNNILIKLAKSSSRGAVIKRVPENLILKQQIILPNEENIKILNSFYNFVEEIDKKLFKTKNIKKI